MHAPSVTEPAVFMQACGRIFGYRAATTRQSRLQQPGPGQKNRRWFGWWRLDLRGLGLFHRHAQVIQVIARDVHCAFHTECVEAFGQPLFAADHAQVTQGMDQGLVRR